MRYDTIAVHNTAARKKKIKKCMVRRTVGGVGDRIADGAEPGPDGDLGGDEAEAEGVVAAVAAVAEEQVVVAVAGAAGLADEVLVVGVHPRAGDGGRRVDGARAAHDVVHGAVAPRRRRLRCGSRRALAPELRRARR